MLDNLQKLLYTKYLAGNLASVYMTKYDSEFINPETWVNEFLTQYSPLADHPDVLKINKTEKENEYKVDSVSIKNFLKFLNYRPIQLKKKFIFLFDAQDLSVIVSNKLLKIFEELGTDFCLILLVADKAQLLPTVESRAIKLQIPNVPKDLNNQGANNLHGVKNPLDLISALKASGSPSNDEKKFIELSINELLNSSAPTPESYKKIDSLLRKLQNYETSASFNNSKLSRLTTLFP